MKPTARHRITQVKLQQLADVERREAASVAREATLEERSATLREDREALAAREAAVAAAQRALEDGQRQLRAAEDAQAAALVDARRELAARQVLKPLSPFLWVLGVSCLIGAHKAFVSATRLCAYAMPR